MAVVRNLMIRIGADYSSAKKGMDGATRELSRFKRDTQRSMDAIGGNKGLGSLRNNLKSVGSSVTASLSEIRGAKGIGGVVSSLSALRPAIGVATSSLRGLGSAAGGLTTALGPVGIAIGVVTVGLGLFVGAVAKASQTAVKFEADLGRLNMQLKGNSREFMTWARSMGLAKSTAAEMGATYGTLLSSFINNNSDLTKNTKEMVQATRVVASATGRTIEDTTERMRSGLLGNTEAIEDLGIFVNVSMIESTNAFKKFANGKHWDQLDFRVQQQIRLAAILEQSYARYGNELQQNVMTKQTLLTEQLKDIKLNLSQAFLPIWDAILPALSKLASSLATVTEELARFTYWLRGWDYDERTKGTNEQTEAVQDQGKAYDGLASSAKKARGELASFDELHLLGDPSGGSGGGKGSSGGTGTPGGGSGGGGSGGGSPWDGLKPIPPELTKKWRIQFDAPNPPDAGLGAVVTKVTSTINNLVKEINAKLAQMWLQVKGMSLVGTAGEVASWRNMSYTVTGSVVPGMVTSIESQWAKMWENLKTQTVSGTTGVIVPIQSLGTETQKTIEGTGIAATNGWKLMLKTMLTDLTSYRVLIAAQWALVKSDVLSLKEPLNISQAKWKETLNYYQNQLNAHQPALSLGFHLVAESIRDLSSPLADIKKQWSETLSDMYTVTNTKLNLITNQIKSVASAWSQLQAEMKASSASSSTASSPSTASSYSPSTSTATSSSSDKLTISSLVAGAKSLFSEDTLASVWDYIKGEADKPENKVAFQVYSTIVPASKLASGASSAAKATPSVVSKVKSWWDSLKGLKGIPAFAKGAVVHGPTLAMVGDNKGAATDPEVIAPLSMLSEYMEPSPPDNSDIVAALLRVEQAIKRIDKIQAVISRSAVGQASVDYINDEMQRGKSPIRTF